jgi:hypothetical protein
LRHLFDGQKADALATIEEVDDDEWPDEERFVFDDADWAFYEVILRQVGDRRVFFTFDGKSLEVMSPSPLHERHTSRIEKLVWLLTLELRIPFESMGSFTLKKWTSSRANRDHDVFVQRYRRSRFSASVASGWPASAGPPLVGAAASPAAGAMVGHFSAGTRKCVNRRSPTRWATRAFFAGEWRRPAGRGPGTSARGR